MVMLMVMLLLRGATLFSTFLMSRLLIDDKKRRLKDSVDQKSIRYNAIYLYLMG